MQAFQPTSIRFNHAQLLRNSPTGEVDPTGLLSLVRPYLGEYDPVSGIAAHSQGILNDIAKKNPNDPRLLFLRTQQCILDSLAAGTCCLTSASRDWLVRILNRFMNSLNMALRGNIAPETPQGNFDAGQGLAAGPWWNTVMGEISQMRSATGPHPNSQDYAGYLMMKAHIEGDLKMAMLLEGVGTAADYKCIGKAVLDCMKENFKYGGPGNIPTVGEFDITDALREARVDPMTERDLIRGEVRTELRRDYGITDPYRGLSSLGQPRRP